MSALDLRLSFAAARAAAAMVSRLPGWRLARLASGLPAVQVLARTAARDCCPGPLPERGCGSYANESMRSGCPAWRAQCQRRANRSKNKASFLTTRTQRQRPSEGSVVRTTPRHAADSQCEARRLPHALRLALRLA